MTNRSDYFNFIQAGYLADAGRLEVEIESWQKKLTADNALLGYMAPKLPLQLGVVAAFLYEQTGDIRLARQAFDIFIRYRQFTRNYPPDAIRNRPEYQEGVPPLDCCFDPIIFSPACLRIRPALTEVEFGFLADIAADSLRLIWKFPEWGGHNRAMLRSASLAISAAVFNLHPEAPNWAVLADELAEESWGRWSIEDAMMYQAHWLRALIVYAQARNKPEIVEFIQPRLHIKSMVQLLSPLGILPDYGDSHWLMHSHWEWLALLEWGARIYHDPSMKWAAGQIWKFKQQEAPNVYASMNLVLAWTWCDENVAIGLPYSTPDALDDLVLKKIVFRNGWDESAAYACLNYRDEGNYALVARDYLRTNLAVSAEKMHHGHSDEGSFSMLVHDGSLLLHESGYRENPPDGIYRADFYHNRVIWRPNVRLPESGLLDFFQDNGHYKPVRTERLYQSKLCGVDISRIRLVDEIQGLNWDRSVFFLPEPSCWVVVDTLLALRSQPRTYGLLWWTGEVLEQNGSWARTHISRIQDWHNARNSSLWIGVPPIPGQNNRLETAITRRSFQDECLIASTWSGEHRLGRSVNFVTILAPNPYLKLLKQGNLRVEVLEGQPQGRGLGVHLSWGNGEVLLATLNDLTIGYLQDEIRPRYTAEQGWMQVGLLGSDAAFTVVRKDSHPARIGFLNGTRLEYQNRILYQGSRHAMFQEDRTHLPGIPSRFRWEGDIS